MNVTACRNLLTAVAAAAILLSGTTLGAQSARLAPAQGDRGRVVGAQAVAPGIPVADDVDARQLRERFYEVLDNYPPNLGRVLKLDPSLMNNESYLSAYPAVATFLAEHPGVSRNPGYFLERITVLTEETWGMDERSRQRRETAELLAGIAAFVAFLIVTSVVVWVIRAIIENRRWNRVSKTQYDVHSRLLERFATNEELLAYIQTPVGRRFLESGPAPVPGSAQPVSAPFSRILWSVQVGIILLAAGGGLLMLSRKVQADAGVFFTVFGVLALTLGAGFMASGAASWALSKRLGLLDRSDVDHA
jgi:hypothetical protein